MHRLTFSANKTVAVYLQKIRRLGKRWNPSTLPRMYSRGVPVRTRNLARNHGVMVDAELNGMAHVAYISIKSNYEIIV